MRPKRIFTSVSLLMQIYDGTRKKDWWLLCCVVLLEWMWIEKMKKKPPQSINRLFNSKLLIDCRMKIPGWQKIVRFVTYNQSCEVYNIFESCWEWIQNSNQRKKTNKTKRKKAWLLSCCELKLSWPSLHHHLFQQQYFVSLVTIAYTRFWNKSLWILSRMIYWLIDWFL